MDTIASYEELVRFFSESGLLHQAEPAEALIKIPTRKDALDGVMFIRWQADHQVVHFVQTMGFEVPAERLQPLAMAMALLNHVLPLPGFGVNVGARQCYFRITMPLRPEGTITRKEIQGLFNVCVRTAAEQHQALRDVAVGNADPMQILQASAAFSGAAG
ncbi:MAG TPA: YbjN domain-containing protein [Haliangium sp.]|nr:YbjN domain-containing protein [Haliangium sp.]